MWNGCTASFVLSEHHAHLEFLFPVVLTSLWHTIGENCCVYTFWAPYKKIAKKILFPVFISKIINSFPYVVAQLIFMASLMTEIWIRFPCETGILWKEWVTSQADYALFVFPICAYFGVFLRNTLRNMKPLLYTFCISCELRVLIKLWKNKLRNPLTFRTKCCEMRKAKNGGKMLKVMRNTLLYTFCFLHFLDVFAYFAISVYPASPNPSVLQSKTFFLVRTDENWEERWVLTNGVSVHQSPPSWCKFPVKPILHAFLLWSIHQGSFCTKSLFLWERMLVYSREYTRGRDKPRHSVAASPWLV